MNRMDYSIEAEAAGQRIDKWLGEQLEGMTRACIQRLCEEGNVRVSQNPVPKNYKLRAGDRVEVLVPDAKPLDVQPEKIPLEIVYEDDDLLVDNKPKGMVVHPAPGNYTGTLVNALLYHCQGRLSGINGVIRPGIVHRIDKDTSGLLIVAKNDFAHQALAGQIKAHTFTRIYNGIVYGNFHESEGVVDAPIGRNPDDRKKMCVTQRNSREAITLYRVLERFRGFCSMEFLLKTGRTHQIRVHMAYKGHPLAGDPVYGPKKVLSSLGGQCLHARTIGFCHPRDGRYLEFSSEPPAVYQDFLGRLRKGDTL